MWQMSWRSSTRTWKPRWSWRIARAGRSGAKPSGHRYVWTTTLFLDVRADDSQAAWITLAAPVRRRLLQRLLDSLDLQAHDARMSASHALLYHFQGSFGETNSEDEQLYWMRENARMVFELGGLEDIFVACKHACWRHDWLSSLPEYLPEGAGSSKEPVFTPQDKAALLEEVNMEVTVHVSQLYSLVELLRGDPMLAEALSMYFMLTTSGTHSLLACIPI